jgi:hypothetical protein
MDAATPETEDEKKHRLHAERMRKTDAEVVEEYLAFMPPHVRAVMAEPLRPLLGSLISRERARCVTVLQMAANYHKRRMEEIESTIAGQIAAGGPVDGLGVQRIAAQECVRACLSAARAINVPPGGCEICMGARNIPGSVVLAGGQRVLVPCPACSVSATNGAAAPPGGG